jgi:ribosomal protein S18 acetylase RimI-like enzyme
VGEVIGKFIGLSPCWMNLEGFSTLLHTGVFQRLFMLVYRGSHDDFARSTLGFIDVSSWQSNVCCSVPLGYILCIHVYNPFQDQNAGKHLIYSYLD